METPQVRTWTRDKKRRGSISFRTISGIVMLLVVFALIIGYVGYDSFTSAILEQYSEGGILTAETAATIIDGDDLYRLSKSNGDNGYYKKVYNELQSLCNSTGSEFIYVIQPDTTDYEHIRFLFSVNNYDSRFEPYEFGYLRKTTNDEYKEKYRKLYSGSTHKEIVIRDRGYIETDKHITAMVPIRGSDNTVKAILCVQRQLDVLDSVRGRYINKVMLLMMLLSTIVIFGQSMYLQLTLIEPLQKITAEAQRFAGNNAKSERKLSESIRNSDEIGVLADSIDQMEERINDYVDHITAITAERERMGLELMLASRIQESMLPNEYPPFPDRSEFYIYASMSPAKEVGGDFYDYFMVDDDHLAMVIADVSGKGIPAALYMMVSMIIIRNQVMTGISPAEVLTETNNQLSKGNQEEMFVTVWLGILDLRTGIMTAANGGHEYPIISKPGGQFELLEDKHGFVVGGIEGVTYTDYQIDLSKGTKLFLYTDGLPEVQNSDKRFFGIRNVQDVLNENREAAPKELLECLEKAAREFEGDAPQFDDRTMMCIESMIETEGEN